MQDKLDKNLNNETDASTPVPVSDYCASDTAEHQPSDTKAAAPEPTRAKGEGRAATADEACSDGEVDDPPVDAQLSEGECSDNAQEQNESTDGEDDGASSFDDGSFASFENPETAFFYAQSDTPPQYSGYYPGQPVGYAPPEDSFNRYGDTLPPRPRNRFMRILRIIGWVCFGMSIFAMFISFIFAILSAIPEFDGAGVIGVLSLFPASCLAIGIILTVRRRRSVQFIVLGSIALGVCLMMLLLALIFNDLPSDETDSDQYEYLITDTEQIIGFDLPDYDEAYYYEEGSDRYLCLDISSEDAEAFLEQVEKSNNFNSEIPNALIGVLHENNRGLYFDEVLIYNLDTEQMNELPTTGGTYNMLTVTVSESGFGYEIEIREYELEYRTSFNSDM